MISEMNTVVLLVMMMKVMMPMTMIFFRKRRIARAVLTVRSAHSDNAG